MFAVCCVSALGGGTALACIAPRTRFEVQFDISGAVLFIGALAAIGSSLSRVVLIG